VGDVEPERLQLVISSPETGAALQISNKVQPDFQDTGL
jgi:hypothetical protein